MFSEILPQDIIKAASLHTDLDRVKEKIKENTFVLLLGPSGVGKSTIIRKLKQETQYIGPYTTRPLREGEEDKVHISEEDFSAFEHSGEILYVNEIYGVRYGTPRKPILEARAKGLIPILDFPLDKVDVFSESVNQILPSNFLCMYLFPPDIATWIQRMSLDGRINHARKESGIAEIQALIASKNPHPKIDISFVSKTGGIDSIVQSIQQILSPSLETL